MKGNEELHYYKTHYKVFLKGEKIMTKELIVKLIANSAVAGDLETVEILNQMLTDLNTPAKKTRAANNTSGYVQVDPETGKEVARYATIKEANAAMGKKEGASCISSACRNYAKGLSQTAYGFKWFYGSDFDAQ